MRFDFTGTVESHVHSLGVEEIRTGSKDRRIPIGWMDKGVNAHTNIANYIDGHIETGFSWKCIYMNALYKNPDVEVEKNHIMYEGKKERNRRPHKTVSSVCVWKQRRVFLKQHER